MKPILRYFAAVVTILGMMIATATCAQPAATEKESPPKTTTPETTAPETTDPETIGPGSAVPETTTPETTDPETTSPETDTPPEKSNRPRFTLDQVLDNMEAARKKLEEHKRPTLEGKVVKLREEALLEETFRSEGTLQFKMPRLLRLDLTDVLSEQDKKLGVVPSHTVFIIGEEYAYIYRPEKKQAERIKLKTIEKETKKEEPVNPLECGLASDLRGLRKAYLLELGAHEKINKKDTIPVVLTPKKGESYDTGKMIIWADTKTWLPAQVREYKSNNEIIETHTISEMKLNIKIKDKVFEVPRGTQVIDHDADAE